MKIIEALLAVMREVDAISKKSKNKEQGYAYRGIDDFYNALHPLMAKHGIIPIINGSQIKTNTIEKGNKTVFVTEGVMSVRFCTEEEGLELFVPVFALDFSDKSVGKAISYGMKYALMTLFMIPTEEGDNDKDNITITIPEETMEAAIKEKVLNANTREQLVSLYKQYGETIKDLIVERRKQLGL